MKLRRLKPSSSHSSLGADLNLKDTDGRTALDAAKQLRYPSVVDFLVEKGAKAGVPAPGGRGGRGGRGGGRGPAPPNR